MAAQALPNVFCTMGHGCDILNEDRKIVPDGCKYITSEICGMASVDLPKILFAFTDPLLKDALQYPDHPKILSVLNEYFKLPAGSPLRVRNAGDSYTDSIITLWGNAGWGYFKSGIYQLGGVPEGSLYNDGTYNVMAKDHPREVNDDLYHFIYNGSIWVPPPDGNIEKRYSQIMEDEPGIYYHLACRVICEPITPNVEHRAEFMRQQSSNQIIQSGLLNQLGPHQINIRPSIHTVKGSTMKRYSDWMGYIHNEHRREVWRKRIATALEEIASHAEDAASNHNVLPNYINVPIPAAAQESNSNGESNNATNSPLERELKEILRGKGRRTKRKTHRKKANRRTHKRMNKRK